MISKKLIKRNFEEYSMLYKINRYRYHICIPEFNYIFCYKYTGKTRDLTPIFIIKLLFRSKNYKISSNKEKYSKNIINMFLYCKLIKNEN